MSRLTKTEQQIIEALNTEHTDKNVFRYNLHKENSNIRRTKDGIAFHGWRQINAARKLHKKGLIRLDDRSEIVIQYTGNGQKRVPQYCGLAYKKD